MNGMDPHMVRDFAQDMGRALATAEARLDLLTSQISKIKNYADSLESTHQHMYGTPDPIATDLYKILNEGQ